jgi:sodium transport system ATP-binding protein
LSIEVKDLRKKFFDPNRGEFFAVDGVSFDCQPGKTFGLLGPNGAGKTTIMRLIATILEPTSGTVVVEGFDVTKQPAAVRKHIGFLSADTGLYERLTPREILTYFARLNQVPEVKIAARVNEVIERLAITPFASTLCDKLSTGMKQRVSIARAIVHDPPVLILDEPTSGLDVIGIRAIHDFVNECKHKNKCLLFSTHIMAEAEKLCDQIALLHHGKIFAVGTLDELRAETNEHYLEDVFLKLVPEGADELV